MKLKNIVLEENKPNQTKRSIKVSKEELTVTSRLRFPSYLNRGFIYQLRHYSCKQTSWNAICNLHVVCASHCHVRSTNKGPRRHKRGSLQLPNGEWGGAWRLGGVELCEETKCHQAVPAPLHLPTQGILSI